MGGGGDYRGEGEMSETMFSNFKFSPIVRKYRSGEVRSGRFMQPTEEWYVYADLYHAYEFNKWGMDSDLLLKTLQSRDKFRDMRDDVRKEGDLILVSGYFAHILEFVRDSLDLVIALPLNESDADVKR